MPLCGFGSLIFLVGPLHDHLMLSAEEGACLAHMMGTLYLVTLGSVFLLLMLNATGPKSLDPAKRLLAVSGFAVPVLVRCFRRRELGLGLAMVLYLFGGIVIGTDAESRLMGFRRLHVFHVVLGVAAWQLGFLGL